MSRKKIVVDGTTGEAELIDLSDERLKEREAEEKKAEDEKPARAFDALRKKRDEFLSETDWRGAADQTMSDAQKKYRSDLRDLPAQYDNSSVLGDITWPSRP